MLESGRCRWWCSIAPVCECECVLWERRHRMQECSRHKRLCLIYAKWLYLKAIASKLLQGSFWEKRHQLHYVNYKCQQIPLFFAVSLLYSIPRTGHKFLMLLQVAERGTPYPERGRGRKKAFWGKCWKAFKFRPVSARVGSFLPSLRRRRRRRSVIGGGGSDEVTSKKKNVRSRKEVKWLPRERQNGREKGKDEGIWECGERRKEEGGGFSTTLNKLCRSTEIPKRPRFFFLRGGSDVKFLENFVRQLLPPLHRPRLPNFPTDFFKGKTFLSPSLFLPRKDGW